MVSTSALLNSIALAFASTASAQSCAGKASAYAVTLSGYAPAGSFCAESFPGPKSTVVVTKTMWNGQMVLVTATGSTSTSTATVNAVTQVSTVTVQNTATNTVTKTVTPNLKKRAGYDPAVQSAALSVVATNAPRDFQSSVCGCLRTEPTAIVTSTAIVPAPKTSTINPKGVITITM